MRYPYFLSDFDGTLVRPDGTVSEANRAAISRYRANGGTFIIVTGRMLTSILPRLKELGIGEGIVAAYQGAVIADAASGKLLKSECFSREDALRTVRFFEGEGVHTHVYVADRFYSDRADELLTYYEKTCRVKAEICPHLSEMIEKEDLRVVKALAMILPEDRDALFSKAERALKGLYVTCSSKWLVEVMPPSQSKASAVDFVSHYYGARREQIAAIGDQLNDLPMLERAGGKFAVGDAEEALLRHAIAVPSCEEDGVAYAIENYAMGDL